MTTRAELYEVALEIVATENGRLKKLVNELEARMKTQQALSDELCDRMTKVAESRLDETAKLHLKIADILGEKSRLERQYGDFKVLVAKFNDEKSEKVVRLLRRVQDIRDQARAIPYPRTRGTVAYRVARNELDDALHGLLEQIKKEYP